MAACRICDLRSFLRQAGSPDAATSASGAYPCQRINYSLVVAGDLQAGNLSLCARGRTSRSKGLSILRAEPQIALPNVDIRSEEEPCSREESDSTGLLQIIVPTLKTKGAEEVLDEEGSTRGGDLEDMDIYPEGEEGEDDLWLSEFQRHLPSEVDRFREDSSQVSDFSGLPRHTSRRRVLGAPMLMSLLVGFGWTMLAKTAHAVVPAQIDLTKIPRSSQFDATDLRLRDAASIFGQALEASTVEEEENLWTKIIDTYAEVDAEWVPDIIARALGNRGNARSRQGQLQLALGDYDRSIELAPYAVDPVLNRGVALESLGRLEEASADYEAVLRVQPDDPAAWNNLGNVKAALSQWDEALRNYFRAYQLAPKFSFAAANYALALYQVGRQNEAVRQFRNLLRRYPEFADVRAALAVSLYEQGLYGEAETNWGRLEDGRYADREWVRQTRRWPPRLANALEDFLDVKRN